VICALQVSSAMYSSHMEAQAEVRLSGSKNLLTAGHNAANSAAGESCQQSSATEAALPDQAAAGIMSSADREGSLAAAGARHDGSGAVCPAADGTHAASPPGASVEAVAQQLADLPLGASSNGKSAAVELQLVKHDTAVSLRMFGAAPSPYLRQAQADFVESLKELVGLANQQARLQRARQAWEAVL
jgi:hypothetical protein